MRISNLQAIGLATAIGAGSVGVHAKSLGDESLATSSGVKETSRFTGPLQGVRVAEDANRISWQDRESSLRDNMAHGRYAVFGGLLGGTLAGLGALSIMQKAADREDKKKLKALFEDGGSPGVTEQPEVGYVRFLSAMVGSLAIGIAGGVLAGEKLSTYIEGGEVISFTTQVQEVLDGGTFGVESYNGKEFHTLISIPESPVFLEASSIGKPFKAGDIIEANFNLDKDKTIVSWSAKPVGVGD